MEEIYPKGLLLFLHTDKASTVAWKVINSVPGKKERKKCVSNAITTDIQMRYMLGSDQTV